MRIRLTPRWRLTVARWGIIIERLADPVCKRCGGNGSVWVGGQEDPDFDACPCTYGGWSRVKWPATSEPPF